MNIMGSPTMNIICTVLIIICVVWFILLAKTNIMVKIDDAVERIKKRPKSRITNKKNSIQFTITGWVILSIASFVLSPVTTYLLCIVIFIFNIAMYMINSIIDDMNGRIFVDHWDFVFPKLSFLNVGIGTWVIMTFIMLIYGINDYETASEKDRKCEEEDKNDKAGADKDKNITPTPTPLPPPKPVLSQVVLPRAPNASVKKYYCLDDGLTTKTWLTMSEAKYYVNTLSLKKLLLLNGKNIVCRVYTKGQWTSHSITRINCDDNGKLSFGRTTKITA